MTTNRSSLPEDKGLLGRSEPDAAMTWGTRQSESETVSRAEHRTRTVEDLVHCPACGSEKTTAVQVADRGSGSSIRRDNPGFKCLTGGTGWTVTIGEDRDPDELPS